MAQTSRWIGADWPVAWPDFCFTTKMAVGQNQWYHFGAGAPTLVDFSGDWDVHRGLSGLDFDPWPNGLSTQFRVQELWE